MTIKNNIARRIQLLLALGLAVLFVGSEVRAQIGFQATFDVLPNIVSLYEPRQDLFSAAMQPKTYKTFYRRQIYQPKQAGSSFESNQLYFTTSYRDVDSLIPIAVDAQQYHIYRTKKREKEQYDKNFRLAFLKSKKGSGRSGVNFGVPLPKRFEKIFGEGGGNLRVNGYRRISFSGRSQWTDGASEAFKQSRFPSLSMEQNYRFDITGTIGSKISVKVSEDSRSEIPLANRIQIRYKGDDDDILKVVEAGNTNLSLPRSKFVGYSSRIQGLFGIKAEAQVGHLTVTAIASQEKGSAEKASISAGGDEGAEIIRDYDYQVGRIFDLGPQESFKHGDKVLKLLIYEWDRSGKNDDSRTCRLYLDPSDTTLLNESMKDQFVQLDVESYDYFDDSERNRHYVIFDRPRYSGLALGFYMEVARENGDTTITGSFANDTLIVLKTLRNGTTNDHPTSITWDYMWRNVYRIPQGVSVEDLNIVIKKGKLKTENDPNNLDDYVNDAGVSQGKYIEILGLDQYNAQTERKSDNTVDSYYEVFKSDIGLLVFPSRFPFDTDTTYGTSSNPLPPLPEAERMPNIYNTSSQAEKVLNSSYYIQYSVSTRSSTIRLNRANIIEDSERITLNGRELKKNLDYTIQYDFGQVTLLTDDALDPNAELEIDFEYAPFLAVQKKTLLGMRAEYVMGRQLKFGTTILYKSDKAQDRKPRVGQETATMMVMDFDFSFSIKPKFLTKAVDALPFISTEAASNISVVGEIAQSRPNPNIDNVAYIDDFETSHEQLSLGTSRSAWSQAAPPGHLTDDYQTGKVLWHNLLYGVNVSDVYDRDTKTGEGVISPFRIVFRPNPLVKDDFGVVANPNDRRPSWGGITRAFGSRVDAKRVQVLELRVKGEHGRMHLDFGQINEDINSDGIMDREGVTEDDFVSIIQDIGLDHLPDTSEVTYDSLPYDPLTNVDPAGDNWYFLGDGICPVPEDECQTLQDQQKAYQSGDLRFDSVYYEWLNGTEGNRVDPTVAGRADQERLSRGDGFNIDDAYFSFVVDLASDDFLVPDSRLNEWKTYRIPITDPNALDTLYTTGTSEPDWQRISHVRIWFDDDGFTNPLNSADTVEVAAWYFVQSNWRDSIVVFPVGHSNTSFVVATVSEEEGTFTAPPGVEGYEDVANDITETQRGLSLEYENLRAKDTCLAKKELLSVEQYSGYRNLEVYVHGDDNPNSLGDSVQFFFRLGSNDSTFYEFSTPGILQPGWNELNYVNLDFDKMTALKDSAQRFLPEGQTFRDVDITVGNYRVKGDPNINQVVYFAAGIVNLDSTREITGKVWLDELRVTNVRRDVGLAGRLAVTGNLADLLTYSLNYERQSAYFRGVSQATRGGGTNNLGSGADKETYSFGLSFNIQKLLPRSLGLNMPISYNYSKSVQLPLLRKRSDVILPTHVQNEERTENVTQSITISESFRHKGKNLLFDALLNRQKFRFSYSHSNNRNPNRPWGMSESYNISGEMNAGWKQPPTIPLLFFLKPIPILKKASETKMALYPNTLNFSGKFSRSLSIFDDANSKRTSTLRRDLSANMRLKYDLFQNLAVSYNFDTRRDLSNLDFVNFDWDPKKMKLGQETNFRQSFSTNYDPRLVNFFTQKYSYTASYNEILDKVKNSSKSDMSNSITVSGSFKHQLLLGGKSKRSSGRQPRARGGRRNVRGGQDVASNKKGDKFYEPVLAGARFLTSWLNPLSYKYAQSFSKSVPGMAGRPSISYRLGFTRDPGVEIVEDNSKTPIASQTQSYEFGSGFTLLGGIVTTIGLKRSISTDLIRRSDLNERTSTAWPNLTVRIKRFTTMPLIKNVLNKFIDVFSPKTNFSRDIKEDHNRTLGFRTSKSESINFSPLLALNLKLFRALSLSGSYTITSSERESYGSTTGNLDKVSRSNRQQLAFSSQYSFSAPGGFKLPIFGRIKFKSDVSISVSVRHNQSFSESSSKGADWIISEEKTDFSITPNISYAFSRQVKGGLSGRWQDTNDIKQIRRTHVRELQIWAELRF